MTKLNYVVGKENFKTYAPAKKASESTGLPLQLRYIPIDKTPKANPSRIAKVQAYFKNLRLQKALDNLTAEIQEGMA